MDGTSLLLLGIMFAGAFGMMAYMLESAYSRLRCLEKERIGRSIGEGPLDEIVDALVEQCGQDWVDASLKDFTLAATVARAIRWHKDTVMELKQKMDAEALYIKRLEQFSLLHGVQSGAFFDKVDGESFREYIERTTILYEAN